MSRGPCARRSPQPTVGSPHRRPWIVLARCVEHEEVKAGTWGAARHDVEDDWCILGSTGGGGCRRVRETGRGSRCQVQQLRDSPRSPPSTLPAPPCQGALLAGEGDRNWHLGHRKNDSPPPKPRDVHGHEKPQAKGDPQGPTGSILFFY